MAVNMLFAHLSSVSPRGCRPSHNLPYRCLGPLPFLLKRGNDHAVAIRDQAKGGSKDSEMGVKSR